MADKEKKLTNDEKLDLIVEYLSQMNRRDKWRTIGGFFRGIISIIPVIFILISMYFFYVHGEQLLQKVAEVSAQQAAKVTNQNANRFIDAFDADAFIQKFKSQQN